MPGLAASSPANKSLRGSRAAEAGVGGLPSPFLNLEEGGREPPTTSLLPLMLMRKDFLAEVLVCHSLGSESGYLDVASSGRGDPLMNRGIRAGQIFVCSVGWVDYDQAAARQSDAGIVRMNGEVGEQHFRNSEGLEPRMHHAAL